jgi:hypothetical protein
MTDQKKTLAEAIAEEDEMLRRRFVHHTRPKGPLTLAQAIALSRRMAGDLEQRGDDAKV